MQYLPHFIPILEEMPKEYQGYSRIGLALQYNSLLFAEISPYNDDPYLYSAIAYYGSVRNMIDTMESAKQELSTSDFHVNFLGVEINSFSDFCHIFKASSYAMALDLKHYPQDEVLNMYCHQMIQSMPKYIKYSPLEDPIQKLQTALESSGIVAEEFLRKAEWIGWSRAFSELYNRLTIDGVKWDSPKKCAEAYGIPTEKISAICRANKWCIQEFFDNFFEGKLPGRVYANTVLVREPICIPASATQHYMVCGAINFESFEFACKVYDMEPDYVQAMARKQNVTLEYALEVLVEHKYRVEPYYNGSRDRGLVWAARDFQVPREVLQDHFKENFVTWSDIINKFQQAHDEILKERCDKNTAPIKMLDFTYEQLVASHPHKMLVDGNVFDHHQEYIASLGLKPSQISWHMETFGGTLRETLNLCAEIPYEEELTWQHGHKTLLDLAMASERSMSELREYLQTHSTYGIYYELMKNPPVVLNYPVNGKSMQVASIASSCNFNWSEFHKDLIYMDFKDAFNKHVALGLYVNKEYFASEADCLAHFEIPDNWEYKDYGSGDWEFHFRVERELGLKRTFEHTTVNTLRKKVSTVSVEKIAFEDRDGINRFWCTCAECGRRLILTGYQAHYWTHSDTECQKYEF